MNRTNRRFQARLNKMSDIDAQRIIRRQIHNKLGLLSSRYDRAVTNDQRVQIANQMEDLCNAEIDYWINIYEENHLNTEAQGTIILEEANMHIANFREVVQQINELRKELLNPVQQ